MADYKKFAILHGKSTTIPTLPDNVLGFTNDTNKLYIGNNGKNIDLTAGGSAIVDNTTYDKASNTTFYRIDATENLTKATHTETTYTASPSKYYKIDTTKASYDSDKGIVTITTGDATNCQYWIHSIESDQISDFSTESTVDDYDFYLDTNGGYYPKNLHKIYLVKVAAFASSEVTYTTDYSANTMTCGSGTDTITVKLNVYPVNSDDNMWMYPILNTYGAIQYYNLVAVSDDNNDTSIQRYIKYENTKYTYFIVHPYLNTAYLIRKTSDSNNDTNTISYKDEFSKSMIQLATSDDIVNQIESSQTAEELTTYDLLYKITNNRLTPNHYYKITDYSITINSNFSNFIKIADTPHYFDIIVQALSTNTISPYASAMIRSTDTTGYYSNSRLDLWKLEIATFKALDTSINNHNYSLIYDTNTNLIITKMIDEFGNECPYDFKNIVMKRYEITADSTGAITTEMFDNGRFFTAENTHTGWTIDTTNPKWLYTFTYIDGNDNIEDLTIKYASWKSIESYNYSQFGNNKSDLYIGALGRNLTNCYVLSNKKNLTPTGFYTFIFTNNIMNNISGTTINTGNCAVQSDSDVLLTNGNFNSNMIMTTDDYTAMTINTPVLTDSQIDHRYIMENSSGIKIFSLLDLIADDTTTLTSGTF